MSCDHKNMNGGVGCIIADKPIVQWCNKCGAYKKETQSEWRLPDGHLPYVDMLLHCPLCHARHIDTGEFETKPHHTHACQNCGHCWRPAVIFTRGVQFLPGFKNEETGPNCGVSNCFNPAHWAMTEEACKRIGLGGELGKLPTFLCRTHSPMSSYKAFYESLKGE